MESLAQPVHWLRLGVAALGMVVFFFIAPYAQSTGILLFIGFLFVVPFYTWQLVQGTSRGAADGALLGLVLGVGAGTAMGRAAYEASGWFFFETEKDPAAFWIWFVVAVVVQLIVTPAVGSLHGRRDIDPTTGLPWADAPVDQDGMQPPGLN